jgi:hypothetical protein
MTEDRCDMSGLLVDQCACRIHAPEPTKTGIVVVARFPARFDSECDACGDDMDEGDPIARTDDGDYICAGCAS